MEGTMPVEHFKSKEAYRKNMAYRHMHGIPFTAKEVVVGGQSHEVRHSTDPARVKIDSNRKAYLKRNAGGREHP
jgi:hypothetical protein